MKIGLVFDDSLDRPDGVQQYVRAIGGWLSGQGHEVHYLAGETKTTDLEHIHSLSRNIGVTFNGNQLTVPLSAPNKVVRELVQSEDFDVLHIMMPYSPLMAAKVIKYASDRTVIFGTFHILPQTWLVRWSTHLLGFWLKRNLRYFDKVVAVSPAAKLFAERAFGLSDVGVLPNVVPLAAFQGAEAFERYADDVPTIVFLGRLVPRKGCATLLDAVQHLKQAGVWPLRVVVCGKGPELAALEAQALRLGIAEAVEFTGFISEVDKPRYLASADAAVFPSLGGESFGIVLIEAMAVGKPVVLAASNPGYASVMEPQPGQLFAPGDSQALAELLKHYLQDTKSRAQAVAWQDDYVQRFDIEVVGQKLLAEYAAQRESKLQKKQAS